MYGKIFDSIYDGTLVEDWRALVTFEQMIVLCDADGIIDMTASSISRRTGIPIEHIKAGIEILENEDPYSRTEGEGGRRIVRLDDHRPWGWYLVNHEKYKGLQDSDTVRAQNRERKRRQRAKAKESQGVTDGHAPSRHTDKDTNTDITPPPSEKDVSDAMIWDAGTRLLGTKSSRSLIGKWVKDYGKEHVAEAIARAVIAKPVEPKGYITAILQKRPENASNLQKNLKMLQEWVDEPG